MLRLFKKKRLREVLVLSIVLISVLPQLLTQTSLGKRVQPFYILASRGSITPWHEFAVTGLGLPTVLSVCAVLAWVTLAYLFAKRQFARSMLLDFGTAETFSTKPETQASSKATPMADFGAFVLSLPGRLFRDPYAALIEKELRSLVRTPRFRVVFGMACVFSALIFFPMAFGTTGSGFMARNYLAFINTYGMLIVGEVLVVEYLRLRSPRGAALLCDTGESGPGDQGQESGGGDFHRSANRAGHSRYADSSRCTFH